jgi:hypothetical protein
VNNRSLALRSIVAAISVGLVASATVASAAPTCTDPATRPACGGRIIAPALQTTTFLQYGLEYKPVLDALEALAPDVIDVDNIGDLIGRSDLKSAGGRDIYVIRVTDESVTTPKRQVAISLSVHGNESAGREGGLRYVEDLANWWNTDPEHLLYAGDVGIPLSEILKETEIYIAVLNVDGWAAGDVAPPSGPPAFSRGNDTGQDLNRDYPTIGWTKRTQVTEPETRAWVELVSSFPNLTTASDIHGELTSNNNAFSDIMYPAGQWDAKQQAQELQFAQHMSRTVERKFAEEGVVLQTLFDLAGDDRPMKPANFATAYDVVGYDDSGFMGDWFVLEGAVELDVENFLSHTVPNNIWSGPLEQAHVAAVKGNIEAAVAESMITDQVAPDLDLGNIAYVFDPARVSRPAPGSDEVPYSVSRFDYFDDLEGSAGQEIEPITSLAIMHRDLSQYDSLVIADIPNPATSNETGVSPETYVDTLQRYAEEGGQLVLTDASLNLLDQLTDDAIARSDVGLYNGDGGFVDFGSFDHPWEEDLSGVVNQTYYAVPLGFRSGSGAAEARNWGVAADKWAAVGGDTVGTMDSGSFVSLGELDFGEGSIAIFGSILPTQTQGNRHQFGLTDYAVTVTGGEVLHSILEHRRGTTATPTEQVTGP